MSIKLDPDNWYGRITYTMPVFVFHCMLGGDTCIHDACPEHHLNMSCPYRMVSTRYEEYVFSYPPPLGGKP